MNEQLEQFLQALREAIGEYGPLPADQAGGTLSLFLFLVQWSAIILSALAGLYAARKSGMDLYGSVVIAFVTALGGGTVRDLLLGRSVFWIREPLYAVTVLIISILSVVIKREAQRSEIVANRIDKPIQWLTDDQSRVFIIIDSLALGLWAYLGTVITLQMRAPLVIAPIMGVITASFGSVTRDLFFAKVPTLFLPGQLYATAAAVGAVVYAFLWWLGLGDITGFLVCFLLTFILRIAAIKFNIRST